MPSLGEEGMVRGEVREAQFLNETVRKIGEGGGSVPQSLLIMSQVLSEANAKTNLKKGEQTL